MLHGARRRAHVDPRSDGLGRCGTARDIFVPVSRIAKEDFDRLGSKARR